MTNNYSIQIQILGGFYMRNLLQGKVGFGIAPLGNM